MALRERSGGGGSCGWSGCILAAFEEKGPRPGKHLEESRHNILRITRVSGIDRKDLVEQTRRTFINFPNCFPSLPSDGVSIHLGFAGEDHACSWRTFRPCPCIVSAVPCRAYLNSREYNDAQMGGSSEHAWELKLDLSRTTKHTSN